MDRKGTRVSWEIEACKKIGVWRQQLSATKVLVHSKYLVEAAHKRGIDVKALVTQKDCGRMPLYRSVLKEVNARMEEWEDKMK